MLFPHMMRFPDVIRLSSLTDEIDDPTIQQRILLIACKDNSDEGIMRLLVTVLPPELAIAVRAAVKTDVAAFFASLHGMSVSV
jgi:hypothetical protein